MNYISDTASPIILGLSQIKFEYTLNQNSVSVQKTTIHLIYSNKKMHIFQKSKISPSN